MKKKGMLFLIVAMIVVMAMAGSASAWVKDSSLLKGRGPVTVVVDYQLKITNNTSYMMKAYIRDANNDSSSDWLFKWSGIAMDPKNTVYVTWNSYNPPLSEVVRVIVYFKSNDGPFSIGHVEKTISFKGDHFITAKELILTNQDIKFFSRR